MFHSYTWEGMTQISTIWSVLLHKKILYKLKEKKIWAFQFDYKNS